MGLDKIKKTPCGFCFIEYPFLLKYGLFKTYEIKVVLCFTLPGHLGLEGFQVIVNALKSKPNQLLTN